MFMKTCPWLIAVVLAASSCRSADPTPPLAYTSQHGVETYAVDDLLSFPGAPTAVALTALISDNVAPGTWGSEETALVIDSYQTLFVCHTPEVQGQVETFLEDLRTHSVQHRED